MAVTDLLFNSKQKLLFARELAAGKLSHAYIVEGDIGTGKTVFALYAASCVLCRGENAPCGVCPSCRKIEKDEHPDLFVFAPEKSGSQLTVGTVREIKKSIYLLPNEGDRKVYIIKDGQSMNTQAQNALLKFLEEPPASSVFFILTDKKESLLPTVISRCRTITLYPSDNETISRWLVSAFPRKSAEEIETAVSMAEGCPGKASMLLDKKHTAIREDAALFAQYMFSDRQFDTASFFKAKKYDRSAAKELLLTVMTLTDDVFRAKQGCSGFKLLAASDASAYARLSTETKLMGIADEAMRVYALVDANANITLALASFAAYINGTKI